MGALRPTPSVARRLALFVLAFGSGFAVLTIEIAGARLIAPVYGLSAVPWTAVIGVILAALAVGSYLGGRLADAGTVPLSAILALAGVTGVLPVVGGAVPWVAREVLGFVPGALASALTLFAPPVLCLGAVVPYLVKADTSDLGSIGTRAGDLSAAATIGSILGSFTTGFFLLPAFPLPILLGGTSIGLLLLAAFAGWAMGGKIPGAPLAIVSAGIAMLGYLASRPASDTLREEQTLYASVRVTERSWSDGRRVREMWQNGGSSSAEYVDDGTPAHRYVTSSLELLGPDPERRSSMLVLGGAGLSLPVAFERMHPQMHIDVVEIDPVVTELAREYFAFGRTAHARLQVHHEDARVFLRRTEGRYDVVYLDVFDHLVTVPWTMVTVEAFREMAGAMDPDGVLMANVLSPLSGPGTAFLGRLRATLAEVFPEIRIYRVDPVRASGATQNLIVMGAFHPEPLPWGRQMQEVLVEASGPPLTDHWAPVESLQARVFLAGLRWR